MRGEYAAVALRVGPLAVCWALRPSRAFQVRHVLAAGDCLFRALGDPDAVRAIIAAAAAEPPPPVLAAARGVDSAGSACEGALRRALAEGDQRGGSKDTSE